MYYKSTERLTGSRGYERNDHNANQKNPNLEALLAMPFPLPAFKPGTVIQGRNLPIL